MRRNSFILPDLKNLLLHNGVDTDKVVIISIVGKSPCNSLGLKAKSIRQLFPVNVSKDDDVSIEGNYDEDNQIVYLHLHSCLDADFLLDRYEALKEHCEKEHNCTDFLVLNNNIKSSFANALLFLIYVSHIVVVSHPGSTFDTNYIQYFHAVLNQSQKIFNKITDALKNVEDISTDWRQNGRFCTPRLIFYFEKCPQGAFNLKKVEHNLEDTIYHVLKKTRLVNTYGRLLFAIPLNEEFVYISTQENNSDRLGDAVRGLIQDCQPGGAMQIQTPFCKQPYAERSFLKFLQVHVRQARDKGFHDMGSSGRHQSSQQPHFEIPLFKHWIQVTGALYGTIIKRHSLIQSLCTDTKFSEQRCLKVLPLAIARYQDNIPPHYARNEHERRLGLALSLFTAQARGPVFLQYVSRLRDECQAYWENGRQQCEALSMTGNSCKLPKHYTSEQEHMSGYIYKAVCDCGRKIGNREDPYNAKAANYYYYQVIGKECVCSKLERISFPVFQPSTDEFKAATITSGSKDKQEETVLSTLSDKSNSELTPENEKTLVRQASTTEYLPGMLTLNSPAGLLPVYSSWSLVCLGPSSLYSHNLGLSDSHYPGFAASTNYLLPWDVTVYSKSKSSSSFAAWPQPTKHVNRGRRGRPAGASPQFSVKVFIGVEYECALGHRFMLAGPDKLLKATPGSIVKDTGHKIAESDMPLYFPCVCRAKQMAQLMRLHVVTPKAPVHCTLDPRVQPGPGAPVFTCTHERPTKLTQSAYWVLRLPYVYVDDKQHYNNINGRLLQGVFGVTEVDS